MSRNIDIDYILIHNLTFFESLNIVLLNMVEILLISPKIATLLWNKGYDVMISAHDISSKILLLKSNYIADVAIRPKFGNCSISMREVIIIWILKGFDQKNQFFRSGIGYSSIMWNCLKLKKVKKVQTKSRQVVRANS